ncbi:MAG: sensor histidine kinase [Cytophagales bacterium]
MNICFLSFYTLCFVVNYFGYTLLAGYLMSYGCAFIIIFASVAQGFEGNILIFFIPLLIANYFLIDFKDSGLVLLQLLFPLLYLIIDRYFDLSIYQFLKPSPDSRKVELMVTTTLSMALSSVFVFFIIKEAYNNEQSIKKSLSQASEQNIELVKRNDELDRFVYSVSHELRAPIATMRGLTNLINQEKNVDEIRNYLLLQEKCLVRLDQYIKDILGYYANDRLNLLLQEVDFADIVSKNLLKFEFELEKQNIIVTSSINLKSNIYSDKYRLNLIFDNILSNAVKYCDSQKPQKNIKISISNFENFVSIVISDNGIGIDAQELPNIFKMFHKSEITTSSSGLGMYIVKESVEKLEGKLEIKSIKREFTEITVYIPDLKNSVVALNS